MADMACRPSDLTKLFRTFEGWRQQIVFKTDRVRIRFLFPKEVDPGSSRNNSTAFYFSSWVEVKCTTPKSISFPELLREHMDVSSGPEHAVDELPLLNCSAQALFFGQKKNGKFQAASVDHVSNMTKSLLQEAGMGAMDARSIRGASPSKIVHLCPDLKEAALRLGRWTNQKTFDNHYLGPVNLMDVPPPPTHVKGNLQQLLRWGFRPEPPPRVSAAECMRGPVFWVGKVIPSLGKITSFDEGIYSVEAAGVFHTPETNTFFHYELMAAVSIARQIDT
jgi:hypothetical protein